MKEYHLNIEEQIELIDLDKFFIISPDGFSIVDYHFESKAEALNAFENWKSRYKTQGYYKIRDKNIPLNKLEYYCRVHKTSYYFGD